MSKTQFRVKEIGYAYASSSIADKLKFRHGCWYVAIGLTYPNTRTIKPGGTKEIKGFADFADAHQHAETLVQPYGTYTWTPEKYAAIQQPNTVAA